MAKQFSCPTCRRFFQLPENFRGGAILCPHCKQKITANKTPVRARLVPGDESDSYVEEPRRRTRNGEAPSRKWMYGAGGIVIGLAFGLVVGILVTGRDSEKMGLVGAAPDGGKEPKTVVKGDPAEKVVIDVTSNIWGEYVDNQAAADLQYTGKHVRLDRGQVLVVSSDKDGYYAALVTADGLGGTFADLHCYFAKDQAAHFANLKYGDGLTVQGLCLGRFPWRPGWRPYRVVIKDCVLLKHFPK